MKKYVRSDIEVTSAMQKLIQNVADEFRKDMQFQEVSTFNELKSLNDWDASDIRSEIQYLVDRKFGGAMYDDGSTIIASDDSELSYRQFKRLVLAELK